LLLVKLSVQLTQRHVAFCAHHGGIVVLVFILARRTHRTLVGLDEPFNHAQAIIIHWDPREIFAAIRLSFAHIANDQFRSGQSWKAFLAARVQAREKPGALKLILANDTLEVFGEFRRFFFWGWRGGVLAFWDFFAAVFFRGCHLGTLFRTFIGDFRISLRVVIGLLFLLGFFLSLFLDFAIRGLFLFLMGLHHLLHLLFL
jgi:hypothetical protein